MESAGAIGIGSTLGGFRLDKELGRGGMGVVYKAHELSLNRKVALKVLAPRLSMEPEFVERFKREAQVVASLHHPNIVSILSYGEDQGQRFFAMDFIEGRDLGRILKERPVIPVEEALPITAQVASALAEAGAHGVVHRDLKPSNIMIDEKGAARVTDFGVAHLEDSTVPLTETGLFLGTPAYASPEQAMGLPVDVRSDIYSLGAVLYSMVSGKPPVAADSPMAVVAKIATQPVTPIEKVNPAVPRPVRDLIGRMMAKEPEDRFQTPAELGEAVDRCIAEVRRAPGGLGTPGATAPRSRAKVYGVAAGIAVVLLLAWLLRGAVLDGTRTDTRDETTPAAASTDVETLPAAPGPGPAEAAEPTEPTEPPGVAIAPEPPRAPAPAVGRTETATAPPAQGAAPEPVEPEPLPALPAVPTVLVVVSGDASMVPLVRVHLETVVFEEGLKLASLSEIPVLTERVQYDDGPVDWYDIREHVPSDTAQVIVLAEIQKSGSVPLEYHGRVEEQTTATFAVRAVDAATGTVVAAPATGSLKFTPLNMEENIRTAVTSAAAGLGTDIRTHWDEKVAAAER